MNFLQRLNAEIDDKISLIEPILSKMFDRTKMTTFFKIDDNICSTKSNVSKLWAQTKMTTFKIEQIWTLDHFSSYLDTNTIDYDWIKSPKIVSPEHPNIPFYLYVYPKGKNAENRDFLDIFLHHSLSDEECKKKHIRVKSKISVMNKIGKKFLTMGKFCCTITNF